MDSLLWHPTPNDRLFHHQLFSCAAKDVLDLLYGSNPGPLHSVNEHDLRKVVLWQVKKDRNNWCGKTPIRDPFYGGILPFDWQGVHDRIVALNFDLTASSPFEFMPRTMSSASFASDRSSESVVSDASVVAPTEPDVTPADAPPANTTVPNVTPAAVPRVAAGATSIDPDLMKPCHTCGLVLWMGPEKDVPANYQLACPRGDEWDVGLEPYCEKQMLGRRK